MTPTRTRRIVPARHRARCIAFAVVGGFWARRWARQDEPYRHLRVFEDVVSPDLEQLRRGGRHVQGDARRDARPGGGTRSRQRVPAGRGSQAVRERGQGRAPGETGIELTRSYYLRVIAVRDGSPAAKAGLRAGDFLRAIDGKPTREMSVYEGARAAARRAGLEGHPARDPRQRWPIRTRWTSTREVPAGARRDGPHRGRDDRLRANRRHSGRARRRPSRPRRANSRRRAPRRCSSTSATRPPASYEAGLAVAKLFVASGTLAREGGARRGAPDGRRRQRATARSRCRPSVLVNNGTSGAAETLRGRPRRQPARRRSSASGRTDARRCRSSSGSRTAPR